MGAYIHRQLLRNHDTPCGFLNRETSAAHGWAWLRWLRGLWLWPRGRGQAGRALWVDVGRLRGRQGAEIAPHPTPPRGPRKAEGAGVVYDPGNSLATDHYDPLREIFLARYPDTPVLPAETACDVCGHQFAMISLHHFETLGWACHECSVAPVPDVMVRKIGPQNFSKSDESKKGGAG